jgi:hypothetical protein
MREKSRDRQTRVFEPDQVAHYEAAGWRAYYDRKWPKLLWLVVSLCQEEFSIPFPVSLVAAYYITRASIAWAPVDHDVRLVRRYYARFYRLARRYSGVTIDPWQVANLELRYNDVHRRLVGKPDKAEFVETMVGLHSAIFDLPAERARESAEWRVEANNTVDLISNHWSTDVEGDWAKVEDCLRHCYRSIHRGLVARGASASAQPAET